MEDYADDDTVAVLPYGHVLHKECLLSWAKACAKPSRGSGAMATCPLCKAPLAEGAHGETESTWVGCCCCCCGYVRARIPARYTRMGNGDDDGGPPPGAGPLSAMV